MGIIDVAAAPCQTFLSVAFAINADSVDFRMLSETAELFSVL